MTGRFGRRRDYQEPCSLPRRHAAHTQRTQTAARCLTRVQKQALSTQPDIEVVGEASDGSAAVTAAARLRPIARDDGAPRVLAPPVTRRLIHLFARTRQATSPPVTEHTVKTQAGSVLRKLDLRDRVHAVIFAYESALIDRS